MTIFEITLFWLKIAPTYYGLMYVFWFVFWYIILWKRNIVPRKNLDDLIFYLFLWIILGWRLGYVLFYNLWEYLASPLDIFKIWEWWMSFHWWVIWVLLSMTFFSKKYKFSFLKLADQICLVLPIWLGFWRIWNYLNKELLWFSPYNWPFAMVKNEVSYFPSPLLEFLLEWFVLFIILNLIYNSHSTVKAEGKVTLKSWFISALFLIFYSIFRIFIEIFFRQPDVNIW
jgi:phosphatidylglycerol:prolipoprotein diacylglycerol transferase